MSSKAEDFDVRYRDAGTAGHGRPAADGGYRGNAGDLDYDLGYDSTGWDTQGFRRPEAGFGDAPEADRSRAAGGGGVGTAVRPDHDRAPRGRREGSHARAAGPAADLTESTQLNWDNEATGSMLTPGLPARGRHGSHGGGPAGPGDTGLGDPGLGDPGLGSPGGPGGPRRPRGPRGLAGPGRRGFDRPRVKVKGSWWRHWTLRKAVGVLLGLVGGIVVLGAVAVAFAYEKTPVPTAALAATGFSQSVVYSKDGSLIGRFGTTNRKMLQYDEIPRDMINAVVAAEDRNFFNEGGISPTGIARAAYQDLTGNDGSLQGGSTITQEFVRQYYSGIGTQQTLGRKIKEIFVAMKVAKEKSKQWILTNYLNTIYLGQGAYGIEAAAETYYGKPSAKLTVAQDAVIAAIIQQPSTYPLRQYRTQLEARWHYVLNGMVQMGTLTEQKAAAMKFPVPGNHVPQTLGRDVWDPYVLNMVQTELENTYHLSQEQIYNGGYVIRTTVDDKKMAALYQAVRENEALINASSRPLALSYMHAAAVLENPDSGAIQAVYAGPGYIGMKYNGTGKVITSKLCAKVKCEWNMAVQNREQVGSSFKPYVLSAAVKAGMNVQTSTLNGFNNLYIASDDRPDDYSTTVQTPNSYLVHNDSQSENGPYTPQIAMAVSINTAYADLWHRVGGRGVATMAKQFGVDTDAACITASCLGTGKMENQAGVALGQASLTVVEQATMLATIANGGTYHSAHIVASIGHNTQNSAPPIPIKVTSYPVFSPDPTANKNLASQVQYAMSKDDAPYGTAPGAGMSNGQEIIAKTGTTNSAQSAFFIGAIPNQAMAVALFTNQQGKGKQTLDLLGGLSQGGMGGTWPASIWHTYAEDMFVPLGIEPFPTPVFTGQTWNQVPPNLRNAGKTHKKHDHGRPGDHGGQGGGQGGNPNPWPTFSCDPGVTCTPGDGGGGGGLGGGGNGGGGGLGGGPVGAGSGLVVTGLPLWARRRMQQRRLRHRRPERTRKAR
ncbi:MAG TPA: transglycosylase domain-containing protein [Streptosporangiaceae bacterium]|nr:transglycosylase domain-containing protein [Streptosporangiaceae bacterium]